ncbi:EAL domain-containing protein [Halomonas sp. McH1-25]|uniref:EAL domain-containing protein n=1 Tax=unclassified Halomonas TaxID=2609666 RepID=UPI001EF53566|nr:MULTISPECIES: EAL domain-containing protein [unclassified Halomonas]MCG7600612.1 EAL domain-containing protein [Halomonas sp. McH1-25]MCP1343235.1 EAL domain-containing protein [Halomonas sp. FL8]MCP1359931.1 EAL domain-containing protein [Halomonas sp. BBD45]MCP1365694.1 EAL domain-containing protein [Halomonas sp. BBD48]
MGHCARVNGHCGRCDGELPFEFSMAFQPIVDVEQARIVAYEALVRGLEGQSAGQILGQVDDTLLYLFDQACRVKAIELASRLDMQAKLSINFLPNAVYEPNACIQATLEACQRVGWPTPQINFELTESEYVTDRGHLRNIIDTYHALGFTTALDDFGAGYANLDLLTDLTPDTLKIDRQLVMNIDRDLRRQAMVRATANMARELGIQLVAEGVETAEESLWLCRQGIGQQQGFYFARPGFEMLPIIPEERFIAIHAGL